MARLPLFKIQNDWIILFDKNREKTYDNTVYFAIDRDCVIHVALTEVRN